MARALRDFGDGFVAVLLLVYLTAMGLGALEVGIAATLALLGSALMTLGIGLAGPRIDQRTSLMVAAGLMVATGLAFAVSESYGLILLIAFGECQRYAGKRVDAKTAEKEPVDRHLIGLIALGTGVINITQAIAQPICHPSLIVAKTKASALDTKLWRKWAVRISVDASSCQATSGQFELGRLHAA